MAQIKAEQTETQKGKYGSTPNPPFKPQPAAAAGEQKKPHWIEIELVDEAGNPVPGEQYNVTLPDGSVASGTLDGKVYFTGRQHAGENLADVLKRRVPDRNAPIQMCDALSRNMPKLSPGVEILLANCLAHGRRQFVEVAQNFPEECRYVLESLGSVYAHDATAREQKLSTQDRLQLHQKQSGPVMEELHGWLDRQLAEKKTEPNSGLGKAITYLLRHWKGLTAFLREAGAPLDNNICEQALKRTVLHRKNALFYKTLHGADVGDIFMSLIHTCQLCGANSFKYLTELQRHVRELAANPEEWMPWNYRETSTESTV
jgi:transposase